MGTLHQLNCVRCVSCREIVFCRHLRMEDQQPEELVCGLCGTTMIVEVRPDGVAVQEKPLTQPDPGE